MPGSTPLPIAIPAAALLLALLTIALWPNPRRALKNAAALAVALLIAALTWAGLLRLRPANPPATGLTVEPELSARGLGRLLLYSLRTTLEWVRRLPPWR